MCRAGSTTTVCGNCAGCMTGAISPPGWPSGHPKYAKLTGWVEDNIDETLSFYRLPRQHHKHLKSTNMLERLNEELKRRTHVVRIFPNAESCLRLVRALAVETHENWLEQHRYLNWTICTSTKRRRCAVPPEPRTPKSGTVLARSRPSRAEGRGGRHRPALTVARRSGWERSGNQDRNPVSRHWHHCRGVIVAQAELRFWMSRRDDQALAVIVAWIGGRPRLRLRSSAARRR